MKLLIELDEEYVKAIDKIKFLVGGRTDRSLQLEIIKAIKNGKALEQESTTKNDLGVDCIDRDSAIKALDYDIKCFEFKSGVSKHMDDIAKLLNTIYETQVNNIKALPSVTPIRPKGHWIETAEEYYKAINEKGGGVNESTDYFTDDIACSECLAKFSVIDNEAERFDFCPNCGAEMEEVER